MIKQPLIPRFVGCVLLLVLANSKGFAQKTIARYYQVRDVDRDGNPSRCDCDYHQKSLVFNLDSTFVYEEVRGRLDPEKQYGYRGTWSMEDDSVVVLKVTHTWNSLDAGEEKRETYTEHFTLDKSGHLSSWSEQWNGKGLLRTSQQPIHKKP